MALLHDGRARNTAEAILWHGGEAAVSRDAFRAMPKADRDACSPSSLRCKFIFHPQRRKGREERQDAFIKGRDTEIPLTHPLTFIVVLLPFSLFLFPLRSFASLR